jgi:hypothetical protein
VQDEHWTRQDERFKLMVRRMQTAARTADELHAQLLKGNKALFVFGEAVSQRGSFGGDETGTLRTVGVTFSIYFCFVLFCFCSVDCFWGMGSSVTEELVRRR